MSDSDDLLARWGIPPTAELTRATRGTNNDTRLVLDGDRRYVLRRYQNLSAAQAVREHGLLGQLSAMDLPFAVPEPLAADDGSTVVLTDSGPAALYVWIPGDRPDPRTAADWAQIGAAAGRLQQAMARLDPADAPQDWREHSALPAIDQVAAWLDQSGVDRELAGWLSTVGEADALNLPVQVIHCDLGLSNLLAGPGGVIVAVLDFEIAGADARANELVALLVQTQDFGAPGWAERMHAVVRGFRAHSSLSAAELEAMPQLFLLRALGSAQWRAGRWRSGLSDVDEVLERVREARRLSGWLDQNAEELRAAFTTDG